eukprot:TRINITY_DN7471_c0_g1_i1.p1 TRINITY_DN7471_c0_g1~~TRINITY_DN7471_c0_g1_i1.p1  ORF type:complete len:106 (+),score=22.83 TRINITY_DN7471_c0_g1_i1:46-363(+)
MRRALPSLHFVSVTKVLSGDGNASDPLVGLFNPQGLSVDVEGNLYTSEISTNHVRKIPALPSSSSSSSSMSIITIVKGIDPTINSNDIPFGTSSNVRYYFFFYIY